MLSRERALITYIGHQPVAAKRNSRRASTERAQRGMEFPICQFGRVNEANQRTRAEPNNRSQKAVVTPKLQDCCT